MFFESAPSFTSVVEEQRVKSPLYKGCNNTPPNSVKTSLTFSIFGAIAVVYPGLVFVKKEVMIEGDFEDHRNKIIQEFENAGYEKTGEDEEKLHFRLRNRFTRFMRAYEDEVTITKGEAPLILNGNRKEILRLESRISYALHKDTEEIAHDDPYDFSGSPGNDDTGSGKTN